MKIPDGIFAYLLKELGNLRAKVCTFFISSLEWMPMASMILWVVHLLLFQREHMLEQLDLNESAAVSIRNKISKVHSALMFCLEELGVWLAFQVFV
jgi:endoribonuclease Dicer